MTICKKLVCESTRYESLANEHEDFALVNISDNSPSEIVYVGFIRDCLEQYLYEITAPSELNKCSLIRDLSIAEVCDKIVCEVNNLSDNYRIMPIIQAKKYVEFSIADKGE